MRLGLAAAAVVTVVVPGLDPGRDRHRRPPPWPSRWPRSRCSAGLLAVQAGREGWAFLGTFVAIALGVAGLFLALFPDVMPTSLADGISLTTTNASATHYTLKIMTVVALIFTPLVLLYQGWTYWVFRKRIAVHHIPEPARTPGTATRRPVRPSDPPARAEPAGAGPRAHPLGAVGPGGRVVGACW